MLFTLVIHTAPLSLYGGTAYSAYQFARALLQEGHSIHRLFFYGEGVHNLNAQAITPQGEFDLPTAWQALIKEHHIDSVVCIAAAVRRGLLDEKEKKLLYNIFKDIEVAIIYNERCETCVSKPCLTACLQHYSPSLNKAEALAHPHTCPRFYFHRRAHFPMPQRNNPAARLKS